MDLINLFQLTSAADQQQKVRFEMNDDGTVKTDIINFALESAASMRRMTITDNEIDMLWYTEDEISSRKALIKELAREIKERHEMDRSNPSNYTNSFERVLDHCHDGNTSFKHEEMYPWMLWIKATPQRRGLERISMSSYGRGRKKRIQKYVDYVIEDYKSCADLDNDDMWEVVARKAQRMSRPERIFAVCLGVADEVSARELASENSNPPPGWQVSEHVMDCFHQTFTEALTKLKELTKPLGKANQSSHTKRRSGESQNTQGSSRRLDKIPKTLLKSAPNDAIQPLELARAA
jgi:hypothetical protein